MAQYETDEEKVEAIKKWWKENGKSVVGGIGLGLAVVFGWRAWVGHQAQVAERASLAFEQTIVTARSDATDSAIKQAELLAEDYAGTPYAGMAELLRAKLLFEKDDLNGAAAALGSAIDDAPDPAIAKIAALRLARIELQRGDTAAAAAALDRVGDAGAFKGDFAAVRGDIALAGGDLATARTELETALAEGAGNAELIRLKLNDLPAGNGS